ncbi:MAG: flippase-like domain-containing protein [Bdellovibrionales bacterium]|nr:flippase-like domain-containing protein [Bdellovibrionales bacterium]
MAGKQKIQHGLKVTLKIAVAAGLIYWLIHKGVLRLDDLKELLQGPVLVIGFVIAGLNLFITTYRWFRLMRTRKINISFLESVKLVLIGIFFNFALPGGVGGDLVKGFYVVQDQPEKKVDAAISVLMDRILGLYAMIIMSLLALLFKLQFVLSHVVLRSLGGMILIAFIVATLGLLFGVSRRVRNHKFVDQILARVPAGDFVGQVYDGFQAYRNHLGEIAIAVVVSLAAQSCSVIFFYLIGSALGFDIGLSSYFFAVPLSMIVTAIPIAPGGIGVGQMAMAGFLALFMTGAERVGAVSMTAFQACFIVWGLVGMVIYLQRGQQKLKASAMAAEVSKASGEVPPGVSS